MKRLAQLTTIVAAMAASGCADAGTAPLNGLVGSFTVASYNGAALPTYVYPNLGACSSMIVGGTLTTAADGHAVFTRSYTTPCVKGSSVTTETRTGLVTVDGTAITIALDPAVLSTPEVLGGTLQGGQLTLHNMATDASGPAQQIYLLVRS